MFPLLYRMATLFLIHLPAGTAWKNGDVMNSEALVKFLEEKEASPELISFANSLKQLDSEVVREYLEKDEAGRRLFLSLSDQRVSKGIETFKTNNLNSLVEAEIAKRFPAETEEQKKLRELEQQHNALRAELKRKELTTIALKEATARNLPIDIVDRFIGDDEESTLANIRSLETVFSSAIENAVSEKFKANGRTPAVTGSNVPEAADDPFIQNLLNIL